LAIIFAGEVGTKSPAFPGPLKGWEGAGGRAGSRRSLALPPEKLIIHFAIIWGLNQFEPVAKYIAKST